MLYVCTQIVEAEPFPEDLSALHNFLLTALLAPSHLGIPAADVHSARRLAIEAQVHLPPTVSNLLSLYLFLS